MNRLTVFVFCTICGFAAIAGDWVFTLNEGSATAGDVTDGTWKFKATINGTNISFGNVYTNTYPDEVTALDFSKPVTDGGSTTYKIVKLDTAFGYYLNGKPHPDTGEKSYDTIGYRPIASRVGALTFPCGDCLTAIGSYAFCQCVNASGTITLPTTLVSVGSSAFQDDSLLSFVGEEFPKLTSIGAAAFRNTSLAGDLILTNVTSLGARALGNTLITSAKFGAALKSMDGNGRAGVFSYCTALTNVTFDADASTSWSNGGMFYGCSKLTSINLAGITVVKQMSDAAWYTQFGESGVKTVHLSEKLTYLDAYTFSGASSLSEVHFYGRPPATLHTPVLSGIDSAVATYVHLDEDATTYDYATAKSEWDALTAGGTLLEEGSTWSETMAGSVYKTRSLLLYVKQKGGELGHWVFDDRCDPAVVSNGVWSFQATKSGKSVLLKDVVGYPTTQTEIDFSKKLTDYTGVKLTFIEISPHFGASSSYSGGPAAEYVSKVVFPTNEFYTIGTKAFCGCVNLTEVVPCVPDFVTTVGVAAFQGVQFASGKGDVRLYGISELPEHSFLSSTATSVTFGPGLKKMHGHWHEDGFYDNQKLTNVVFDAAMTNCVIDGSTYGPFDGCTSLACDIDLSGCSKVQLSPFNGSKITSLTFGAGLTELCASFCQATTLTNVTFKGLPPKTFGSPYLNTSSLDGKKITTTIYWANRKATNTAGKCWLDYAANGKIGRRSSTFATDYIRSGVSAENRPLIAPDAVIGLTIFVK